MQSIYKIGALPILAVTVLIITLYSLDLTSLNIRTMSLSIFDSLANNQSIAYEISTSVCKIPFMDPYDPSVKSLIKPIKTVCWSRKKLVKANDTHLIVQKDAFSQYYVKVGVKCYYQSFWRFPPKVNHTDRYVQYDNKLRYFSESIKVEEEFVKVVCKNNKKQIYMDFFAFVPIRKVNSSMKNATDSSLNIILIGLDSISRLNFCRQMPKTRNFLDNKLNAIEFFGNNKVGDNTFPNLMAALTGHSADELRNTCWKHNTDRMDNCSFIWDQFHDAGYVTGFAEEMTNYGLFTYNKGGFNNVPVMHYWETFCMALEHEIDLRNVYITKCNDYRPTLPYLLDYTMKFIRNYHAAKRKFFGLFWESVYTHDTLNYDPHVDSYYLKQLTELQQGNFLNNSVLFFMSDHGLRFGPILEVFEGRMEERLPFFYVILPEWFKEKYPSVTKNLKENGRKLTTHFDLYETMKSIMNEDYSTEPKFERGVSLFTPVPENRTCESAGIPSHWCTCKPLVPVEVTNKTVITVTQYVLSYIMKLVSNNSECVELSVKSIADARMIEEDFEAESSKKMIRTTHYTVVFQTQPGDGVFEATVKCSKCVNDFQMAGPISRNNLYGHQSDCVHDSILKLYCYCK